LKRDWNLSGKFLLGLSNKKKMGPAATAEKSKKKTYLNPRKPDDPSNGSRSLNTLKRFGGCQHPTELQKKAAPSS
jgi:hypothetical protein